MRRSIPLLVSMLFVVAACADESASSTTSGATTTSIVVTTTAEPVTTTTAATTSTTAAATTTTTAAPTTTAGPVAMPSRSGCTPPGDVLPDGDWFGFIEDIELITGADHFAFDLACHFEGDQAELAAVADGYPTPLEFTPYIRNQNPKVFDILVSAGAMVEDFLLGDFAFRDWVAAIPPDFGCADPDYNNCPVWVRIEGGVAVLLYDMLPEWSGDDRG